MLILTRKENQKIRIGTGVVVTVEKVKGSYVKISVEAPKEVLILRDEVIDRDERRVA